jgi:hypothetical protein
MKKFREKQFENSDWGKGKDIISTFQGGQPKCPCQVCSVETSRRSFYQKAGFSDFSFIEKDRLLFTFPNENNPDSGSNRRPGSFEILERKRISPVKSSYRENMAAGSLFPPPDNCLME